MNNDPEMLLVPKNEVEWLQGYAANLKAAHDQNEKGRKFLAYEALGIELALDLLGVNDERGQADVG